MSKTITTTGPNQYDYIDKRRCRPPFPQLQPGSPRPTRRGIDTNDRVSPFVEDRPGVLHSYYSGYPKTYWDHYVAYAEVILLRSGSVGFPRGRDTANMRVCLDDSSFDVIPRLARHRQAAIQLFDNLGRLRKKTGTNEREINVSARFLNWPDSSDDIYIQRADYFAQLATNLTMDWASGFVGDHTDATVRNTFEQPEDKRLRPLCRESRLANTLGVAAMIRTADGFPLLTVRSEKVAVMTGRLHCSASGVFQWEHLGANSGVVPFSNLLNGMRAEIKEELNLPAKSYELIPLALARELPRGGKPQLFCSADCELTLAEIKSRMELAVGKWEWLSPEDLPENSPARRMLDRPDKIPATAYIDDWATYEGWMAWSIFDAYHSGRSIFNM